MRGLQPPAPPWLPTGWLCLHPVESIHLYREVESKADSLLVCGLPFDSQRHIDMLQLLPEVVKVEKNLLK